MDYILRATAANNQIRAFVMESKELVEEARRLHNTSPIMTAALGRLLTAGAMMGCMLKDKQDLLTLSIRCEGEAQGLCVTADNRVTVRGYAVNPDVMLPPNALGKLDVAGALGQGVLTVIKDVGLKTPYNGQTILVTSEIAEDITYYFATSEQTPSSVALGVLMSKNNTVQQAGGFIVQLMPYAEEKVISKLEENISKITSITSLFEAGNSVEDILYCILDGLEPQVLDRVSARYECNCSKDRVMKAIAAIGRQDLHEIISEGKPLETSCQFCNKVYNIEIEDILKVLNNQ